MEKGRAAFAKFECYACHEVKGETRREQGKLGPELSVMGPLHEVDYFAGSIINPGAVAEGGTGYQAADGSSKMLSFNDSMTVQELIDVRRLPPGAQAAGRQSGPPRSLRLSPVLVTIALVIHVIGFASSADEAPIAGTLKTVDVNAKTLTVESAVSGKVRQVVIDVTPTTRIARFSRARGGFKEQAATLDELKPGWTISVTTKHDGPHEVVEVVRVVEVSVLHLGRRDTAVPHRAGLVPEVIDPDKILFDPYARALHFPPGFDRKAAIGPGANAGRAPLGLIAADREPFDWDDDRRPRHEATAVIYELHVRGFTAHSSSGMPADRRGTFAGLIDKIPYLLELGVTVVELMPVFQFDPGDGNYWGYNPISFFAPHTTYAHRCDMCDQHTEFRELVRAFHAAGLEVVLDVVYNHTGEGNQTGPIYSFKGLDNDTYYILSGRLNAPYADFSGTGNSLNSEHRYVRRMILDSLRYWAREMRADGFRFDLASVFARRADGSLSYGDPPIFGDIASDPDLARLRLIAEPWDAAGAYQLGRAFPGVAWAQWNGRFRDDVRRFVRGDAGIVPALMQRLYGSDDIFPDDRASAYHAYQGVNFVTSHDGFTLWDLVSYERKRNWANGHDNTDGTDNELSNNSGWEGDEGAPPEVIALRKRQAKNFLCLLLIANGTPMLRAGDEFLHTQKGNNNPYNQDNETSWLDWRYLDVHGDVFRFVRAMIAFRKAHPSLCRSRFWRDDIRWYGVGPQADLSHASRSLAFCLRGASQDDDDVYVMINAYPEALEFTVQDGVPGEWRRVVDTGRESPDDIREPEQEVLLTSARYTVGPRSVVILVRPRQS